MPLPFLAMAGASLIGSGIQAFGAARTNRQNLRAQQQRQQQLDQAAGQNASQISNLFGNLQGQLGALQPIQGQQASVTSFNPQAYQPGSSYMPDAFSFNPLQAAQVQSQGFNPTFASMPGQIAGQSVDASGLMNAGGGQAFNAGQDGLMQFLRADPAGKMQGTNGVLQEIAATGLPSDISSLFTQASAVNRDNNADLLAQATGTGGGLGQRFGSATQRVAGDTARRLANEQSLQNSQLALQVAEAAAGRRLGAASQLGQFQLQGNSQLLQAGQQDAQRALQAALANQQVGTQVALANQQNAFNTGTFNANMGAQNSQFNAGASNQASSQNAAQVLQALLANQQSANSMGQFNVGTAMQSQFQNNAQAMQASQFNNNQAMQAFFQNNAQAMQANQNNNAQAMQAIFGNNAQQLNERQALLQQLGMGGQFAGQQGQLMNQNMGMRFSQPVPQAGPGAMQALGSGFSDLASLMALFNRYGGGGNAVPSMPNVFIPPVNIGAVPGANLGYIR